MNTDTSLSDGAGGPVTLVITRRVKPGKAQAYEAWLQSLQQDLRNLPGYLGVTTQRPAPGAPLDDVNVLHFESLEALQNFERSPVRMQHLEKVTDLVEGDAAWRQLTGLEFWFTPPPGTVVPQPSRPRMTLLMTAVVFGLVLSIGSLVNAATSLLPFELPYAARLIVWLQRCAHARCPPSV